MQAWRIYTRLSRKPQSRVVANSLDAHFEQASALVETRGKAPGPRADLPPSPEQRILKYFGCSKQPFADIDDPDLTYLSTLHLEAVKALIDAVECNLGFSALIAEAGMGKTTLLCRLLECYSTAAYTAFLAHTCGNASGLKHALLNELQRMMMHGSVGDRRVLFVLDEAHNLTYSELEVIQLLSGFENPASRLLHVMLAGRPELADKLLQPPLVHLRKRITVVNRDLHLNPIETREYINHRLKLSGYSGPSIFSSEAVPEIAVASRGIPRQINRICDKALSLACALDVKEIGGAIIRDIIADPAFQVLSSPDKRIFASEAEGRSNTSQWQPLPLVNTMQSVYASQSNSGSWSSQTSIAGRLRPSKRTNDVSLASQARGYLREAHPAGPSIVGVVALFFLLLYMWPLGVTSPRPREASAEKGVHQQVNQSQSIARLPGASASSPLSNEEAESSQTHVVSSSKKSSDRNGERIDSPATIASEGKDVTINHLGDPEYVPRSGEAFDLGSDAPPQLVVAATSREAMPPLAASLVSPHIPISPVASNGDLVSTPDATSPQVVKMVRPGYPSKARKQKVYGEVVVTGVVGADGKLKMVTASGPALLEEAALKAVQEWRYKPSTIDGNPVETTARIVFNFSQTD